MTQKEKKIYHKLKNSLSLSRDTFRVTVEVLSATKIPSVSAVKRLTVQQGKFLKRELQVFILKF